jgi:transposase
MTGQPGFFDAEERLRWLSACGDPLERLRAVVDFEAFRGELEAALPRADRSRGGRPPYDTVLMFRVLVLQALYTLSDEQTEYQLRDRLSFMRFAGLALHDAVPDAKTIWLYREQLTRAGALGRLFARFDAVLAERGFLAMGGQIVDATVVEARRPRLTKETKEEKATLWRAPRPGSRWPTSPTTCAAWSGSMREVRRPDRQSRARPPRSTARNQPAANQTGAPTVAVGLIGPHRPGYTVAELRSSPAPSGHRLTRRRHARDPGARLRRSRATRPPRRSGQV